MAGLLGNAPDQAPTNGDLGGLAYRDHLGMHSMTTAAPTVASAATIQPVSPVAFVSGTTSIDTITVPRTFSAGGMVTLIPTGLWSTTTAGNIALATTAVVGKALTMIYDGSTAKWYPSY